MHFYKQFEADEVSFEGIFWQNFSYPSYELVLFEGGLEFDFRSVDIESNSVPNSVILIP